MSRVDEARRRAAGNMGDTATMPGDVFLLPLDGDDVAVLARTSFPVEARQPLPLDTLDHSDRRSPSVQRAPPLESVAASPAGEMRRTNAAGQPVSLRERIDAGLAGKTVIDETMLRASREQYRRLAAVLHDAQRATPHLRVVMIASAVAGEGKTLTATNLALTFSESYRKRVLLVDADLRRPTLDALFHLDSTYGLSDGLSSGEYSKLVVRQVSPQLAVLPAGRPNADPMASLVSERMRRVLDEARQRFDWVILDTPPLELLPDAHLLASIVDGAILVIKAESTPHALIKRAADAIGSERMLGVVLNHTQTAPDRSQDYSYQAQEPAARR